jgi:hypothetical protein
MTMGGHIDRWAMRTIKAKNTLCILQTGMNAPRLLLLKGIRSNPSEMRGSAKPDLVIRVNGRRFITTF